DYMTGGAVSFANLGTVTLSPPTLAMTESNSLVSGPNPPQAGSTSTYDITVTAQNGGGSNLLSPSIAVVIPAGTTLVSQSTTTGVVCPAGPIAYGSSVACTVTVTDTTGAGATVPTGAVAMTGTLGTSTACTLAAATASSATCSVTFTATGVGSASLGAAYAGD